MRFQITGKHIDIGDALRSHVESSLDAAAEKYARRPTDAQVIFSRSGHEYAVEATLHLSSGLEASAKGRSSEIYPAFDQCCDRMEKQLRRYKRRLKDHHRNRPDPVDAFPAASYILAGSEDPEVEAPEDLSPVIVAETKTQIPSLSVGEAVMRMELSGAAVFVFRNEGQSAGVNVVYRRDDGNIGWIDPN